MKKAAKVIGVCIFIAAAGFLYLSSADGQAVLEKYRNRSGTEITGEITGSTAETDAEGEEDAVLLPETNVPEEETSGFNDIQKEELRQIISTCIAENMDALMEDGRLPSAVSEYQKVHAELINVNTADEEELTELTGIGPAKAKEIVRYREEHGPFQSLDDLCNVSGISTGTVEKLSDQATL